MLVWVVVGRGHGPDLLLEAGQGDAVNAHVTVHANISFHRFCITLYHKVSHTWACSEVAGVAYPDVLVGSGERFALPLDTLFEHTCEQEV